MVNQIEKWSTLSLLPAGLAEDRHAVATLINLQRAAWFDSIPEGWHALGHPQDFLVRAEVPIVFDSHEGKGFWYRLFHRHIIVESYDYSLRVEGRCEHD